MERAGIKRLPCIAHILHNSVKNAIESHDVTKELVEKCHKLATIFHQSPKLSSYLEQEQEKDGVKDIQTLAVKMDVVTRWNSTLTMLRRLLQLKNPIDMVRLTLSRSKLKDDTQLYTKLIERILSQGEWNTVEELIKVLTPFEKMTLLFSSSSSGLAACIAPWIAGVFEDMKYANPRLPNVVDFQRQLKAELEDRMVISDTILVASAFHPTFNTLWFMDDQDRAEEIKMIIREEYERNIPRDDTSSQKANPIDQDFASNENNPLSNLFKRRNINVETKLAIDNIEFDRYFELSLVDRIVDPHKWWMENKSSFPVMAKLARKYLAIPATSVASERIFSYTGGIITDKRNRLSDDVVSDIIYCNYATKCLKNAEQ